MDKIPSGQKKRYDMEDILKFENRDKLYNFLIKDFGFKKIDEEYYANSGNFYITLLSDMFLLRYNNDRLFLTIEIASITDPDYWLALSFVKDFLHDKENINSHGYVLSNTDRIEELNNFLITDFVNIRELYSYEKYPQTKKEITELLKQQSKRNFPPS